VNLPSFFLLSFLHSFLPSSIFSVLSTIVFYIFIHFNGFHQNIFKCVHNVLWLYSPLIIPLSLVPFLFPNSPPSTFMSFKKNLDSTLWVYSALKNNNRDPVKDHILHWVVEIFKIPSLIPFLGCWLFSKTLDFWSPIVLQNCCIIFFHGSYALQIPFGFLSSLHQVLNT
jgi:hypothetical protein